MRAHEIQFASPKSNTKYRHPHLCRRSWSWSWCRSRTLWCTTASVQRQIAALQQHLFMVQRVRLNSQFHLYTSGECGDYNPWYGTSLLINCAPNNLHWQTFGQNNPDYLHYWSSRIHPEETSLVCPKGTKQWQQCYLSYEEQQTSQQAVADNSFDSRSPESQDIFADQGQRMRIHYNPQTSDSVVGSGTCIQRKVSTYHMLYCMCTILLQDIVRGRTLLDVAIRFHCRLHRHKLWEHVKEKHADASPEKSSSLQ